MTSSKPMSKVVTVRGDAPPAVGYAVSVVTTLPLAESALVARYRVLPSGLISAECSHLTFPGL
jgi:hypothetical protein